jgi:hypothetical protein
VNSTTYEAMLIKSLNNFLNLDRDNVEINLGVGIVLYSDPYNVKVKEI